MRKFFLTLALVSMTAFLLVGCTHTDEAPVTDEENGVADEDVVEPAMEAEDADEADDAAMDEAEADVAEDSAMEDADAEADADDSAMEEDADADDTADDTEEEPV